MSEWYVEVQSMIPTGQLGDRLVIAKIDRMAGCYSLMHTPVLTTHQMGEGAPTAEVFMTGVSFGDFHEGEIDQFLQAMMDAGWKRGLRPKAFDPSAGELAAVNRHLEDLRRLTIRVRKSPSNDVNWATLTTRSGDGLL